MTLWPHQEQADEEMWEMYRRRTARPGSLPPLQRDESKAPTPQDTTAQRRGRLPENPQSAKDA